jgi:hypothetical protein
MLHQGSGAELRDVGGERRFCAMHNPIFDGFFVDGGEQGRK